jgi:hypothetical protein
VPRACPQG